MDHLKLFQNHSDYENFVSGGTMVKPNVSHCVSENEVHYNPFVGPYNGHAYVDLGLPSGTLWATMNVGAATSGDTGLLFAWGETQGYTANQVTGTTLPHRAFSMEEYAFATNVDTQEWTFDVTKYNDEDNLMILEPSDDAVSVNMGGNWKLPTIEQIDEMTDSATSYEETENGAIYTFENGAQLSFPFIAARDGTVFNEAAYYLTSSRDDNDSKYFVTFFDLGLRSYGYPARGVIIDEGRVALNLVSLNNWSGKENDIISYTTFISNDYYNFINYDSTNQTATFNFEMNKNVNPTSVQLTMRVSNAQGVVTETVTVTPTQNGKVFSVTTNKVDYGYYFELSITVDGETYTFNARCVHGIK